MEVLLVEPGKEARMTEVGNDLRSLQSLVGGYIEATYPFDDPVALVCNDEGKIKFKASAEADDACRVAIENAISRNYDGSRLNTKAAIAEVREQFGEKRMARVTASLIANREHDGRISPENKVWAERNATTKKVYTDRTHSGLLDIFATRLRESERKRERGAER